MARKKELPKRRDMVVVSMMLGSAKAGSNGNKKKKASKNACRGKVRW